MGSVFFSVMFWVAATVRNGSKDQFGMFVFVCVVVAGYASILGVGGDYVFSYMNFLGLNISIVGACVYSYFKLLSKQPKKEPQPLKRITPSSGSSSPRV